MLRDKKPPSGPRPDYRPFKAQENYDLKAVREPTLKSSSRNNLSRISFGGHADENLGGSYEFLPSPSFDDLHSSITSSSNEFDFERLSEIGSSVVGAKRPTEKMNTSTSTPEVRSNGTTRGPVSGPRPARTGSIEPTAKPISSHIWECYVERGQSPPKIDRTRSGRIGSYACNTEEATKSGFERIFTRTIGSCRGFYAGTYRRCADIHGWGSGTDGVEGCKDEIPPAAFKANSDTVGGKEGDSGPHEIILLRWEIPRTSQWKSHHNSLLDSEENVSYSRYAHLFLPRYRPGSSNCQPYGRSESKAIICFTRPPANAKHTTYSSARNFNYTNFFEITLHVTEKSVDTFVLKDYSRS
ncbi:uncharacterized protein L3040_000523 [Drepanopeziza brunnea f. sp. 'multigermtubi']|uniref:uncharacterized protein n=1 Tax=Drepanopeziza brunnea f. sp. 'multigermtubi' TaxID=698441 RepID=UPI002394F238|nr:hypothetical protein L3040_000523 [Drepanopeziza brunnea f. sp. 'multigermtubi']